MFQRAPLGAQHPHAPPRFPLAWDPHTMQFMQNEITRRVGAQVLLAFGVVGLAFCWAPLIGLVFPICVLAFVPAARRLADWYAAYFPHGFPGYHTIGTARVLGLVALCISSAFQILYIVWAIWLNLK
jgi:hypothetical protein